MSRIFDGTSWGSIQITSGAGISSGPKQISSDSDSINSAYVAYLLKASSGKLMVARWSDTGFFQTFELANGSLSHSLPSITITPLGTVHIFTLSGGKVYDTRKYSGWISPANIFGTTFVTPNELTAAIGRPAALWTEGSFPDYDLRFGTVTNL